MLTVITYDIADDKRRTRLAKELENYGQRVQYSVFECDLDEARLDALLAKLYRLVDSADSLRIYRLCQTCLAKSLALGGPSFAIDPPFYQV